MAITQRELRTLLRAEKYAKDNRALIKDRMSKGEVVEPGQLQAKLSAQVKRTPDYQGFILENHGADMVYKLKQEAEPVQYLKLDIWSGKKVSKYGNNR